MIWTGDFHGHGELSTPLFPLTNGLGSLVAVHLRHLAVHENKIVKMR